jgi:hypothetical protein
MMKRLSILFLVPHLVSASIVFQTMTKDGLVVCGDKRAVNIRTRTINDNFHKVISLGPACGAWNVGAVAILDDSDGCAARQKFNFLDYARTYFSKHNCSYVQWNIEDFRADLENNIRRPLPPPRAARRYTSPMASPYWTR